MKITLAKSAGFCFGVKRAVDTVYEQLEMSAAERQPIYTFGPIIHNEEVVRDLEEKGVTVLESVEELEERAAHGGTVIIRAHGVEKGISEKIKELGKGMHGVLANIISVPSEYETAIEMCLGASLQNIVTDTEEDAQKLVEHLRKNNLGRASFLPITSVKGKKVENIKGKKIGVIGIAADLVKFDKKYEQII